ncbi:MAG: DUF4954 family protein [Bacteroidales bacterium]|nr:DUF4954 family protein [Bacteroidales bacterium]
MTPKDFMHLTPEHIAQLEAQGNTAEDWNNIFVYNNFSADLIWRNHFEGEVELGRFEKGKLHGGDLMLTEGIYDSRIRNCRITEGSAVHHVRMLSGYTIWGTLYNIGQMTATATTPLYADVMNENGGRRVIFDAESSLAQLYLMAKMRGCPRLLQQLEKTVSAGYFRAHGTITNCQRISNTTILGDSVVSEAIAIENSVIGYHNHVVRGCVMRNTLTGENVHIEDCARINDSIIGDNSTIARCEVGNSFIFPAHEQHHNNSFLIAATIMGQSNIAAGATIGSNHNGRTADGELRAGRGFWAGLCTSFKHPSYFASYCLVAKGDYPNELNITLPFSLINNNAAKNQLEVMPAYWWLYNMYALRRNEKKFAERDKRTLKLNRIEFDPLAPDTVEEIVCARELLRHWTEQAYLRSPQQGEKIEITANAMEHGRRKVVILKAAQAYAAYEQMLYYYIGNVLTADGRNLPSADLAGQRETRWMNLGGLLVPQCSLDKTLHGIENSEDLDSYHIRDQIIWLFEFDYPKQKRQHAYRLLCDLSGKKTIDEQLWQKTLQRYDEICRHVDNQVRITREKDDANPFRRMMYDSDDEMHAVLG